MTFLRALLIWFVALSLPIEGMAANAMTHCKHMQKTAAHLSMQGMSHHDHAAMMAAMSDDAPMAHMHHHTMQDDSAKKVAKTLKPGCQCGCKCGGNCALSCANTVAPLMQVNFAVNHQSVFVRTAMPRSQAHAAYRYDPLRPPSAVAL